MKTLDIDTFNSLNKHDYILIHVLPKEHYQNFNIEGSLNICIYEVAFLDNIKKLNLDSASKIVLYGEDEDELSAKSALLKLQDAGYKNVYILEGGLRKYRDVLNLEVDKNELDTDQLLKLDDKTYALDKQSFLQWTGKNSNGKHYGKVTLKSGKIEVQDSLLSGEFIIDMDSIQTLDLSVEEGSKQLDEHLKSDDFFLTKLFPEAKYTFKNIPPVKDPYLTDVNYIIDGELTLKGIKKKQSVNATVSEVNGTLVFNATAQLDRTHWNVIYGSSKFFKFLGMHKIFDKVFLEMRLELR